MNAEATLAGAPSGGGKISGALPRRRYVLGRREAKIDGKLWRFELRTDGLHVRKKHGWRKKERVLSFLDLVHAARRQGLLKLCDENNERNRNHEKATNQFN